MQKEWTHTANGRDKDEAEAEVKQAKGRKGGRGKGRGKQGTATVWRADAFWSFRSDSLSEFWPDFCSYF